MPPPSSPTAQSLPLLNKEATAIVREFLDFVNASVTPFHCVRSIKTMLLQHGFKHLSEAHTWDYTTDIKPGAKCFVTRNDTTIVAFTVGGKYAPGNGVKIVGAHTDSPNLQLKPKTYSKKGGYMGVGVQTYGGGLWHTWFDRDLTIAGRLVVSSTSEDQSTKAALQGPLRTKLVHIKRPLLSIPCLAIHLRSADERDKFGFNKETHLCPAIATELMAKANEAFERHGGSDANGNNHDPTLMKLLAQEAGVKETEIVDFDLSLVDTQPATVGGAYEEFIYAPRIDNLISCFCAAKAMCDSVSTVEGDSMVRLMGLFDHEEVGSASSQGAEGSIIPDIFERLCPADVRTRTRAQEVANSFILSVDGAHAVHPSYADKHESEHRPVLHQGPVVKYNANTRYATNGATAAVISQLAAMKDVPLQKVCVRNDSPCGTTIGPILTSLTGVRGVDLGNAMLAMHSIREMCGTVDVLHLYNLLGLFFEKFNDVTVVSSSDDEEAGEKK